MHKSKNQILVLFYFFITRLNFTIAQSTLATSANDVTSEEGSLSYSVGQLVFSTIDGLNFSILEGVQQPYEITTISSADDLMYDREIDIYPNPVSANLIIESKLDLESEQSYKLIGIDGRVYLSGRIKSTSQVVPMSKFLPGAYFLIISESNKYPIQFKIVKH